MPPKYRDNGPKYGSLSRSRTLLPDRAYLANYRVIQRDLVYVIGIPIDLAQEDILRRYQYFGQYGELKKIVINNSATHASNSQKLTVSAYITFENIEDAKECIYAFENFSLNGHPIKASYGTSKYCSSFLSGHTCNNTECMYLHSKGDDADSFSTEEISSNSPRFVNLTRPPRPDDYLDFQFQDERRTVFPPRRLFEYEYEEEIYAEENLEPQKPLDFIPKEPQNISGYHPNGQARIIQHKQSTLLEVVRNPKPIYIIPLQASFPSSKSLTAQLELNQPSIRTLLNC